MKKRRESGLRWVSEISGVVLLLIAALVFLSLASHHPEDASWGSLAGGSAAGHRNLIGPLGANLSWLLFQVLGFASFLLPIFLGYYALSLFGGRELRFRGLRVAGGFILLLGGCSLLALAFPAGIPMWDDLRVPSGGFLGEVLAGALKAGLNPVGAYLLTLALLALALILATQVSLADTAVWAHGRAVSLGRAVAALWADLREERARRAEEKRKSAAERAKRNALESKRREEEARRAAAEKAVREKSALDEKARRLKEEEARKAKLEAERSAAAATAAAQAVRQVAQRKKEAEAAPAMATAAAPVAKPSAPAVKPAPAALPPVPEGAEAAAREGAPPSEGAPRMAAPEAPPPADTAREPDPGRKPVVHSRKDAPAAAAGTPPTILPPRPRAFALPGLGLLDSPSTMQRVDEQELLENSHRIVAKFQEFAVGGKVLQIHPGPVVTTYEFKPDAGIKISRILSLQDDLSMALQAESIRIDRLPGRPTVGIEVPNRHRETIALRELLESEPWRSSPSRLTLALGKTIEGEPCVGDLAKMPHLLIAGATGSGKSVALNTMIASIAYKATPDEVKFIMVDPKMLELGLYKDIPHLYAPVVTDARIAANALKWAVGEMENRYRTLALAGVRNIDQYNHHVRSEARRATLPFDGQPPPRPLPFIVVVVDELADLMLVAGPEVEDSLARLAQMARAVGIHLILATQRPSVDVITGVIKANFPARISFRVSSKVDSRTILDQNGAETLLGKGDMLYLPPGSARLHRLHAPLLTEKEINALVAHLRAQAQPDYDEAILAPPASSRDREDEDDVDELYDEAARMVVQRQEASVSFLQRRLKVGYARAARLVDMMERDGLVGPPDGSKVRPVLVEPDYFTQVDSQMG